jgi:hypothetical protein
MGNEGLGSDEPGATGFFGERIAAQNLRLIFLPDPARNSQLILVTSNLVRKASPIP